MRRLICTFVVRIWHKTGFSWRGPNMSLGTVKSIKLHEHKGKTQHGHSCSLTRIFHCLYEEALGLWLPVQCSMTLIRLLVWVLCHFISFAVPWLLVVYHRIDHYEVLETGQAEVLIDKKSQVMRKRVLCHMRTTKAQICLRICAVWSAPLLFALWIV